MTCRPFRFHKNRQLINRNLYAISPCLRQMLSLWQTTYSRVSFINATELLNHAGAFDLVEFIVSNYEECSDMSPHIWHNCELAIIIFNLL